MMDYQIKLYYSGDSVSFAEKQLERLGIKHVCHLHESQFWQIKLRCDLETFWKIVKQLPAPHTMQFREVQLNLFTNEKDDIN